MTGFPGAKAAVDGGLKHRETMRLFERALLTHALDKHGWHLGVTARELGMHRNNLRSRMKILGITNLRIKRKPVRRAEVGPKFENHKQLMAFIRGRLG